MRRDEGEMRIELGVVVLDFISPSRDTPLCTPHHTSAILASRQSTIK